MEKTLKINDNLYDVSKIKSVELCKIKYPKLTKEKKKGFFNTIFSITTALAGDKDYEMTEIEYLLMIMENDSEETRIAIYCEKELYDQIDEITKAYTEYGDSITRSMAGNSQIPQYINAYCNFIEKIKVNTFVYSPNKTLKNIISELEKTN